MKEDVIVCIVQNVSLLTWLLEQIQLLTYPSVPAYHIPLSLDDHSSPWDPPSLLHSHYPFRHQLGSYQGGLFHDSLPQLSWSTWLPHKPIPIIVLPPDPPK